MVLNTLKEIQRSEETEFVIYMSIPTEGQGSIGFGAEVARYSCVKSRARSGFIIYERKQGSQPDSVDVEDSKESGEYNAYLRAFADAKGRKGEFFNGTEREAPSEGDLENFAKTRFLASRGQ